VLRPFNRHPRAPIGRLPFQSPRTHCRSVRRDAHAATTARCDGRWSRCLAERTSADPRALHWQAAALARIPAPRPVAGNCSTVHAHAGRGSGMAVKRVRVPLCKTGVLLVVCHPFRNGQSASNREVKPASHHAAFPTSKIGNHVVVILRSPRPSAPPHAVDVEIQPGGRSTSSACWTIS
jgi:hypothetical protein